MFIYPAAFHFGKAVETLSLFSRDGLLHIFLGAAINILPLGIPVAYDQKLPNFLVSISQAVHLISNRLKTVSDLSYKVLSLIL